ncbi:hypothetical protein [Streptomyces sp. NPDC060027]
MINTYGHDGAELLVTSVAKVIPALSRLLERARAAEELSTRLVDQ